MIMQKLLVGCLFLIITSVVTGQTAVNNKQVQNQNKSANISQPQKGLSNNYDPDFFLVIDSVLGNWNNTRKYIELRKKEFDLNTTCIDADGVIYAIGNVNIDGYYFEHVYRFINGDWQVFEEKISGDIVNLITDGKGIVYAVTQNKIYRASNEKWQELVTGTFTRYNVFAGYDGYIYFTEPVYEKKMYVGSKLFKVKNAKPDLLYDNGKPLIVTGDLQADRNGNIYQYSSNQPGIKIWNGEEWHMTEDISLPVDCYWAFDKNNTLYISGLSVGKNMFIKVLNGLNWKNLTIPDSLSTEVHDWQLFTDIEGEVYLKADKEFEEAILYHVQGDIFELKSKKPKRQGTSQQIIKYFPTGGEFIVLQEDQKFTVDYGWKTVVEPIYYNPKWDVNIRKMAHIPNYEIVSEPYKKEYKNLYKCYLFEDNGKYGIQTMEGRIIAESVFDKIYIGYTPSQVLDLKQGEDLCAIGTHFCYTLIKGKDTLFSKIGSYDFEMPSPGTLEMFKCKASSTCNYCNGTGLINAHTETITVKGKWVPPSGGASFTSTTYDKRWDGISGRYVMYINTKTTYASSGGGYYEPDIQKNITVPERKCDRCEGRPIKRSFQIYKFNRSNMEYYETWN